MRYSLAEIRAMPVIGQSWADDLLRDDGENRLWVSRLTTADGALWDNGITAEKLSSAGKWVTVDYYEAT